MEDVTRWLNASERPGHNLSSTALANEAARRHLAAKRGGIEGVMPLDEDLRVAATTR